MKRAYTIIEILIVLAMIGLLAGFGIPAFENYGKRSVFNQKVDEVKELMNEAYNSAKNPGSSDLGISSYYITFDKTSVPHKFVLSRCNSDVGIDGQCTNGRVEVKTVELTSDQVINDCKDLSGNICNMVCTTDPATSPTCTYLFPPAQNLSFTQNNIGRTATFKVVVGPSFTIDVTYTN